MLWLPAMTYQYNLPVINCNNTMKILNEFVFHSVHKFEYKTWYALKYNTYIHKANNKKNVGILFWKVSCLLLGFFLRLFMYLLE